MNEQKHGDLLAVQAVYKAEFAEQQRLLRAGGTSRLTTELIKTTSGGYRQIVLNSLIDLKKKGERAAVPGRLVGVSMGKWTANRVTFYGCEDYSKAKWVRNDGSVDRTRDPSYLRYVQTFEAINDGQQWMIDSVDTKFVSTFANSRCNGVWYS